MVSKAALRSRSTNALVFLNHCRQLKQLFLWNETNYKQNGGEAKTWQLGVLGESDRERR